MNRVLFLLLLTLLALQGIDVASTLAAAKPDTAFAQLVAVHGTLVAAQAEYRNRSAVDADGKPKPVAPFLRDDAVGPYLKAVESFNHANDLRKVYDQAVALHSGVSYSRKQFEKALETALLDVAAMQKVRGINP